MKFTRRSRDFHTIDRSEVNDKSHGASVYRYRARLFVVFTHVIIVSVMCVLLVVDRDASQRITRVEAIDKWRTDELVYMLTEF